MLKMLNHPVGLFVVPVVVAPLIWVTATAASEGEGEGEGDVNAVALTPVDAPEAPVELGPINVPLQDAMYRCGLDPEALAAAGVTAAQVPAVVLAVGDRLDAVQTDLETADSAVAQGRTDVGNLRRLVRSGQGSAEDVTALATAKASLEAALADRDECLDDYHAAGCGAMTQAQSTAAVAIRANRKWKVPTPYLVDDRTPEDWLTLQDFLDVERIETNWGHAIPSEVQTFLSAVRSDTDYALARVAYDANLQAIEVAHDLAIRD